jgi:hypothetical protein
VAVVTKNNGAGQHPCNLSQSGDNSMNDEQLMGLFNNLNTRLSLQEMRIEILENQVNNETVVITRTLANPDTIPVSDTTAPSGGQKAMLCPECSSEMKLRTNREKGTRFWGCTKFPACRGTRDEDGLSRAEREAAKLSTQPKQDPQFTFNRPKNLEPTPEAKPTFTPPWKSSSFNPFKK